MGVFSIHWGSLGPILMAHLICEESWTDGMTARQTHGRLIAMLLWTKVREAKITLNHSANRPCTQVTLCKHHKMT